MTLTERIVELVPEIEECETCGWKTNHNGVCVNCNSIVERRPIQLHDVLRAFQNNTKAPVGVDMNGYFINCDDDMKIWRILDERWNLSKDLENQSQETKDFLEKILL